EGNITFFSKTDSTLNLNDKVAAASLCNGAPNASNSNCEHWLNFDTNDDEWHQYYFAWRDATTTKQFCRLTDSVDASHCNWTDSSYYAKGDTVDTVSLWMTGGPIIQNQ